MTNEVIKAVARAIAKASGINDWFKAADEFKDEARAALTTLASVPPDDDCVLAALNAYFVPDEPQAELDEHYDEHIITMKAAITAYLKALAGSE